MPTEANTESSKLSGANKELSMEEVLNRVADHDVEALQSLYDEFAPKLMGLLIRILPAKPDAESALQEVFLQLWKEAPGIVQTKGSVAAWLVLMARHAACQRLRAQRAVAAQAAQSPNGKGRTREEKPASKSADSARKEHKPRDRRSAKHDSETLWFLTSSPQLWMPRPADIALVDTRLNLLQRAFNQMPKQQRSALELAVFAGYTESEIATQLGEPLGKVNASLRAAFTFLRHRQHAVLGTWTAEI